MCPPEHFTVEYAINPWMDTAAPVDVELAVKQWERLRETLTGLGHTVHVLPPEPGLPDMVYAANGAFTVDGTAYGARFRYPQRTAEAAAHRAFYERARLAVRRAGRDQRGRGRLRLRARGRTAAWSSAGYGFRTEPAAHAEAQEALRPAGRFPASGRPALLPPRRGAGRARRRARRVLPGGVLARLPAGPQAALPGRGARRRGRRAGVRPQPGQRRTARGAPGRGDRDGRTRSPTPATLPVPVELGELKKGGGSVKCCVAELRGPASPHADPRREPCARRGPAERSEVRPRPQRRSLAPAAVWSREETPRSGRPRSGEDGGSEGASPAERSEA